MTKSAQAEQDRIVGILKEYFKFVAIPNGTYHSMNMITLIRNNNDN
tara:strand:- start:509 stop:646 length:138 start_codon:yes stop_codon:yes gene_type:complete